MSGRNAKLLRRLMNHQKDIFKPRAKRIWAKLDQAGRAKLRRNLPPRIDPRDLVFDKVRP